MPLKKTKGSTWRAQKGRKQEEARSLAKSLDFSRIVYIFYMWGHYNKLSLAQDMETLSI